MSHELFVIICNRIEVSGEKLIPGSVDPGHMTGQADLVGQAHQVKGLVQCNFPSWRYVI